MQLTHNVQAYRWIMDSRDQSRQARLNMLISEERRIQGCHGIYNCTLTCPKHLNPAKAITNTKNMILEQNASFLPGPVRKLFYDQH